MSYAVRGIEGREWRTAGFIGNKIFVNNFGRPPTKPTFPKPPLPDVLCWSEVGESDLVDWANLTPTKDIGQGWFEKGIESKTGGGKCPMPFVE